MAEGDLLVTQKAITFGPAENVLLVRTDRPEYPWVPPGGRVRGGEAVEEALAREMREETGLDVTVHRPVAAMTDAWVTDDGEALFTVVYRCETDDLEVSLNHEHDEFEWFSPDAAVDRVALESLETAIERARHDRNDGSDRGCLDE